MRSYPEHPTVAIKQRGGIRRYLIKKYYKVSANTSQKKRVSFVHTVQINLAVIWMHLLHQSHELIAGRRGGTDDH